MGSIQLFRSSIEISRTFGLEIPDCDGLLHEKIVEKAMRTKLIQMGLKQFITTDVFRKVNMRIIFMNIQSAITCALSYQIKPNNNHIFELLPIKILLPVFYPVIIKVQNNL
jgi:hypothetical protein